MCVQYIYIYIYIKSHWVFHSFGLVPHRSEELRKLLYICINEEMLPKYIYIYI